MKVMYIAVFAVACVGVAKAQQDRLSILEERLQQSVEDFLNLNQKIYIPGISNAVLTSNYYAVKDALQDVMQLNRTITNQLDSAIGLWDVYLSTNASMTKDGYLIGQMMTSFLNTLRSLFLRSSVDQAMILSLVKKDMDRHNRFF